MFRPILFLASVFFALTALAPIAGGQNWLTPPPEPAANPSTPEKIALGQALFWDEQLSSSQSVACGTCHISSSGGSDPRSRLPGSIHPGADGVFGSPDDIVGSRALHRRELDGTLAPEALFGLHPQVTGRKASPSINALLNAELFWDGRASFAYKNPVTGQTVLPAWAALESQAVVPVVSDGEMAHVNRSWAQVAQELADHRALALSPQVPAQLEAWISGRTYDALFAEAFQSPGVDVDRIAMALATYQRSLFSDQTPLDAFMNGDTGALSAQQQSGLDLFQNKAGCVNCHSFPLLGRQQFHYTGVRPVAEDRGRGKITNNPADDGKMMTPGLRNVALRAPYFHHGGAESLQAVIDFYDRGGDFNHANKSAQIVPLGLTSSEKADLLEFLTGALTDPRVLAESGPFARPLLRSEDLSFHQGFGLGTSGTSGIAPRLIIDDPARLAGSLPVAVAELAPGQLAWLGADLLADPAGHLSRGVQVYLGESANLQVFGPQVANNLGLARFQLSIPALPQLLGAPLYLQALAMDAGGPAGFSATAAWSSPILTD